MSFGINVIIRLCVHVCPKNGIHYTFSMCAYFNPCSIKSLDLVCMKELEKKVSGHSVVFVRASPKTCSSSFSLACCCR